MPICPGCERKVPYQQLDVHQRYCKGIRGRERDPGDESVEARLSAIEDRFDERLREVERDLERRLARIEGDDERTHRVSSAERSGPPVE